MTAIVQADNIVKTFKVRRSTVTAVDDVSLRIDAGASYGLVGESGSGKTTVARCMLRLIEPTSGTSMFNGVSLATLDRSELRSIRRHIGVVFQNPVLALNPRMRVGDAIAEPLQVHSRMKGSALTKAVDRAMADVGLAMAHRDRLPHQLSGGQCQRVGIARALITQPELLVLDEPTSALDVSVQAQILNLLRELRVDRNLTYLLISHDLDVVRYMCERVAVMREGKVVEEGPAGRVLQHPDHEYTALLIDANPGAGREALIAGGNRPRTIEARSKG